MRLLNRFVDEREGQDLLEYGLLAVFIAVAAVLAVTALGNGIVQLYTDIAAGMP